MQDKQEHYLISDKTQQELIDHTKVLLMEEHGIVQCGLANCREQFSVFRKQPQQHMLLCTVQGKGWLDSQGSRWILEPGSVMIVPAGTENAFGIEEDGWQLAWLFLDPSIQWPVLDTQSITYAFTPAADVMYAVIQTLLRSLALPIDLSGAVMAHAIQQIILMLHNTQATNLPHQHLRLKRVFDRAQRQLHKAWDVKQLAALYPCSEPHLHRLCQQYLGRSPMAQLTRMRMEYAGRLLRSSQWSVQQIGEIVGYPTPANFSTRFKAWSGVTPRAFRQQHSRSDG
ncbi:helix-turn-helix transcriptional regulator (plasmid) [Photobacterium sp. GJ3]|uniref:AraC family transcriptional regulator n=1 Tax=Photobacterium sp. GJ3 TaxID=2829502 RepID=UPI001B8CA65A|nr:AraC family transcriptional regulator [Photobacterium sp. GJ3]QUJ69564.1 helix-turn-helix transcriptional regulator [Photobacterium sp. GJ3]